MVCAPVGARASYNSKMSFRTSNGILINQGFGGSSLSIGGLHLAYSYYFTPEIAVGLGYSSDFDFTRATTPVSGVDVFWRWYFRGQGVPELRSSGIMESESRDLVSLYAGLAIARKDYFLGSNPVDSPSVEQTGQFTSINGLFGLDYALSRSFELTAEADVGLLVFAASDNRFFVRSIGVNIGISYLW